MNESQKFLLDNSIGDIVVNEKQYPENTPENAKHWVYLSDVLDKYERHIKGQKLPIDSVSEIDLSKDAVSYGIKIKEFHDHINELAPYLKVYMPQTIKIISGFKKIFLSSR